MSILGRYLSVRYVSYVSLVLFALVFLALAFELLEKADQVLGAAPNGGETLALFALLRLPELTIQMLPFACLLGTLITIMVLARHSELIAIWGRDVRIWHARRPAARGHRHRCVESRR